MHGKSQREILIEVLEGSYKVNITKLLFDKLALEVSQNKTNVLPGLPQNPQPERLPMTGIIEQIAADVAQIKQFLMQSAAQQQPVQQQPQQPVQQFQQPVQQYQQPVQQQPQQQYNGGAQVQVTDTQIMQIVETQGQDPNVRQALQGELAAMGIQRLPDARPDQYPEIYARFTAVVQRFQSQQPQQQPMQQQPLQQQPQQQYQQPMQQQNPGGISLI